ncbi:MAG: hypothetical protein R3C26_24250 [Calditrichia bacterium]
MAEQNANLLSITSLIVANRMFWLAIAGAVFTATYRYFSFSQTAVSVGFRRRKQNALRNIKPQSHPLPRPKCDTIFPGATN